MRIAKALKFIQLALTILYDAALVLTLCLDRSLRYTVLTDRRLLTLFLFLWIGGLASLLFLVIDLSQMSQLAARDTQPDDEPR